MRNIDNIRKDINKVDENIIRLLRKRFDLSREVKEYKIAKKKPIFDPNREREILKKIRYNNRDYGLYFEKIYEKIMEESKNLQKYDQRYGLLGKKLGHSFSKTIHEKIASYKYEYFEKEEQDLEKFFLKRDFKAINVTTPYKKKVVQYLDKISDKAQKIGVVNTIVNDENTLVGYNTDYDGFLYSLKKNKIEIKGKKILILGSGATSKTVSLVLSDLGAAEIVKLSRKFKPYFNDVSAYLNFDIIVNTTPVGMYPKNEEYLKDIVLSNFKNLYAVIDYVYNPFMTKILIDAKDMGIKYVTGLDMLIGQAIRAEEYFLDKKISKNISKKIKRDIFIDYKNIALIGMPSAGKTSIGENLSKKINRKFVDIDREFEKNYGNIEKFFNDYGEDEFRKRESQILKEFSKQRGLVIACGGGVIEREINYYYLKENSLVVNIDRDINLLEVANRPVSKKNNLRDLYKRRKKFYDKFKDLSVYNDDIDRASDEIVKIFYGYFSK